MSAHPISVRRVGQLANSSASGDQVAEMAPSEPQPSDENCSNNLIHTDKSGGHDATSDEARTCNQDINAGVLPDGVVEDESFSDLPGRLVKYARQTSDAFEFGTWLKNSRGSKRLKAIAHRVSVCGSYLVFHRYFQRDVLKLADADFCCMAMLCPFCAGRRAVHHLQNTVPKLRHVLAGDKSLTPYLLTITIKDEQHCADMYKRIKALWSTVLEIRGEAVRRKRGFSCWAFLSGGVMSFEVKRGSGSGLWHIHGHAVVCGPVGLDPVVFKAAWSQLVGYKAQLDLRPLDSTMRLVTDPDSDETKKAVAKDLMEVFKYALKFNALTYEDRREAFEKLQGRRMISGFGSFYGLKLEDEFADDLSDLKSEPYVRMVFNAICGSEGRQYGLTRSHRVTPGQEGEGIDMEIGEPALSFPDEDFS